MLIWTLCILSACNNDIEDTKSDPPDIEESDTDTDTDTDSDTDTDTDTDTDSDTDTDTDTDLYDYTAMYPGVEPHECDSGPSELPDAVSVITEDATFRYFETNEIPDHAVGSFPNGDNPYEVVGQSDSFQVRIEPVGSGQDGGSWPVGVALNGVTFDPSAAIYWNSDRDSGWEYAALSGDQLLGFDCNYAHVNPSGAYHYHGFPEGLLDSVGGDGTEMVLFGWAADGNPIYGRYGYADAGDTSSGVVELRSSYQLRSGERSGDDGGPTGSYDGTFVEDYEYVEGIGDLDECNGRTGATPDLGTRYYYVVTDTWPYLPRCVVQQPHSSFFGG